MTEQDSCVDSKVPLTPSEKFVGVGYCSKCWRKRINEMVEKERAKSRTC